MNTKVKILVYLLFSLLILNGSCRKDTISETSDYVNSEIGDLLTVSFDVSDAMENNSVSHESASDYTWNESDETEIMFNGTGATVNGTGVSVNGSVITITSPGNYALSGTLSDGQLVVNTSESGIVRCILKGVSLNCSDHSPMQLLNADKVLLWLTENTLNTITDGGQYADSDSINAAIFGKVDMTIAGSGSLNIQANYKDGIVSKDGLIITGGNLNIQAIDDGIVGKDYLIINDGQLNIQAGGDGLKSDNDEDTQKGYVLLQGGNIEIESSADAVQASTDVLVSYTDISILSGGGHNEVLLTGQSAKGFKAGVTVVVDDGEFNVDCADDAFHSNDFLVINGGNFDISTGDDGIRAELLTAVTGGDINMLNAYEGIESANGNILLSSGSIIIHSSDDGINLAGGGDEGMPFGGGQTTSGSDDYILYLTGSDVTIYASGDGIDANGSILMSDGQILVHGPTQNNNGAIDYNGYFNIGGGLLIAAGSAGMAQAPGSGSVQYSVLVNFSTSYSSNTLFRFETESGEGIFTFAPSKTYSSVAFSCPEILEGNTYKIYTGGTIDGTPVNGLYLQGDYTPGNVYKTFTVSNLITSFGSGHP